MIAHFVSAFGAMAEHRSLEICLSGQVRFTQPLPQPKPHCKPCLSKYFNERDLRGVCRTSTAMLQGQSPFCTLGLDI
jgi:hypothetical protein